jgi:hypothetical protein
MLIIVCNSVGVVHCEFALLDGQWILLFVLKVLKC